jgi:hypothetical protein
MGFLVGTAALGAIGVSVLAPSAQAVDGGGGANRQAALILASSSAPVSPGGPDSTGTADSAQGASAEAMAQARVQSIAATRSAAQASAAASAAAPAPQQFPATADGFRAYALAKIGAAQFSCLNPLWNRESHWNPAAKNPSSTAYGIAQLLDSTWHYTGVARTSDGFRQVDAGLIYLKRAYPGGPCGAWAHEKSVGWY